MVRLIIILMAISIISCSKSKTDFITQSPCEKCIYFIKSNEITARMNSQQINDFFFNNAYQGNICTYLDTVKIIKPEYELTNKICY